MAEWITAIAALVAALATVAYLVATDARFAKPFSTPRQRPRPPATVLRRSSIAYNLDKL
jgi:hypothetical protein